MWHAGSAIYLEACGIFSCGMWTLSCRVLIPWPGMEPGPPALRRWRLSQRTTREVPGHTIFNLLSIIDKKFPTKAVMRRFLYPRAFRFSAVCLWKVCIKHLTNAFGCSPFFWVYNSTSDQVILGERPLLLLEQQTYVSYACVLACSSSSYWQMTQQIETRENSDHLGGRDQYKARILIYQMVKALCHKELAPKLTSCKSKQKREKGLPPLSLQPGHVGRDLGVCVCWLLSRVWLFVIP